MKGPLYLLTLMFMVRNENSIGFTKIYVLQHLRPGDRLTGEEIERTIKYCSINRIPEIFSELINIQSREHLFTFLKTIHHLSINGEMVPYIHLEFHGCKDGIEIGSDLVSWESLKLPLLAINQSTKNNLFVSTAACYGAYLFRILRFREPCPFFGFIGPETEIYPEELEINFSAFFETLLKESSFDAAIACLNNTLAVRGSSVKYTFFSCYGLFDMLTAKSTQKIKTAKGRNEFINETITHYKEINPSVQVNNFRRKAREKMKTKWYDDEIEKMRMIFTHGQ